MGVRSFRELFVWQRAIELTVAVYGLSRLMPKEELFGLTSQIRRASVSIASNIAEGQSRGTTKDFRYFLVIARGSNAEVQTQLVIIRRLGYANEQLISECEEITAEVGRMLNGLLASLQPKSPAATDTNH